ncbi:MAG: ankyrin repeat domain-containing protein [Planctomycetes bacterium]|nr:ankyrin repeat domain-containing protein [Planctomycetota bacterium]
MTDSTQRFLQAAGSGDLDAVQSLLAAGLDVDACNAIGYTPLMSAARSYRVEIVQLLLAAGADPNRRFEDDNSVLHAATLETPSQPDRQATCVRLLLEAGADADVPNTAGITPLMQAAWFGCEPAVAELLDHGADPHAVDTTGRTAQDIARARGHAAIADLLASAMNS